MIPSPVLEPLPIATWEPGWARGMEHPAVGWAIHPCGPLARPL